MSTNKIKICGLCFRNNAFSDIKFIKSAGSGICRFYSIDDCCDDCFFSKQNQYKEDKKQSAQMAKHKKSFKKAVQNRSGIGFNVTNANYHGGGPSVTFN